MPHSFTRLKTISVLSERLANIFSRQCSPGVALYTVFGFMAGVSGWLMWQCFMGK